MADGTVAGYAAMGRGQPLSPFTYPEPGLGEHEVRVAVTHCGVCYSDIDAIDDRFGSTVYPLVPGHEIVGRVTEAGGAALLRVGDRVGIGWQGRSCGKCPACLAGEEHLCRKVMRYGTWTPYGGFADAVVVDGRFAYPLPAALAPEKAAVLMCAGITVFSPLRRFGAGPGVKVGVVGIGGLGHLAVQFAHAMGAEVTALSSSPGKEEEVRALGADHFLAAGDPAALEGAFQAFDLVLCTAHRGVDWERLVLTLRKRGRLVLVAFPRLTLDTGALVTREISITGSYLGSPAEMREMLAFAAGHAVDPQVEVLPMAEVNEAILRVRQNRARYRMVLVNP